jgi:hypothetical protein
VKRRAISGLQKSLATVTRVPALAKNARTGHPALIAASCVMPVTSLLSREAKNIFTPNATVERTMRPVHNIHRDDLMKPDLLSETALIVGLFAIVGLLVILIESFR